jgi:hypothetical protein
MEDIFEDKFDANGRLLPPKHILNEVNLKGVFNCASLTSELIRSGQVGYPFLQKDGEERVYRYDFLNSRLHGRTHPGLLHLQTWRTTHADC